VTLSKQSVITALRATGTRDPDILERKRIALRSTARSSWIAGGVLLLIGALLCLLPPGVLAGLPVTLAGAVFGYRGWRNVNAVEAGYAEFVNSSGR
jgi:hypothetical protein